MILWAEVALGVIVGGAILGILYSLVAGFAVAWMDK